MNLAPIRRHSSVLIPLFIGLFAASPLFPQPSIAEIVSEMGTGTTVNSHGKKIDIGGGTISPDGGNLFHSFERFGLDTGQAANFLASPAIHNILGRVVGGDPSIINGLIQVTGGNSNLFLMNPAGIVFGDNARLNVPGDFTATTATGIGFGDNYFNAFGENEYQTLIGNPTQFAFDLVQPGAIVNTGDLRGTGGDINVLGGSILNAGNLTGSGTINIAAVPGTSWVRVSQSGMILALELPGDRLAPDFSVLDIPALLTTPEVRTVTQTTAAALEFPFNAGDVSIAGNITAETVNLGAASRVRVAPSDVPWVTTAGGNSAPTVTLFPSDPEAAIATVFIDATVEDYQDLLYGGKAGTVSIVVTPEEAGISAIGDRLSAIAEEGQKVDEVHIVTEGNAGNFWLGQDFVSAENIDRYREQLQAWGESLSGNADILLYSCFTALGEAGKVLIEAIATETGADVAASTTLTGNAALGGDWVLESSTGNIEASLAFTPEAMENYDGKLAVYTVTTVDDTLNGGDGVLSLREALVTANASGLDDEIRFASGVFNGSQGAIVLSSLGELTLEGTLTISGAFGASNVVIDGAGTSRIFNIVSGSTITLDDLTIRNGKPPSDAGGGILADGGTLNITNSTISGNQTTAGWGGGIYTSGTLNMTASTVSSNTARGGAGGGIYARTLNLTNSTVSGNQSDIFGGGIMLGSAGNAAEISSSTIANNQAGTEGGGIYGLNGTLDISNAIVANNTANGTANEIDGSGITGGTVSYSLIEGTSTMTSLTFTTGNITGVDPQLLALADNGGSTQTHALSSSSPAINRGNNSSAPATDQRGFSRGNLLDIGAFEVQDEPNAVVIFVDDNVSPIVINEGQGITLSVDSALPSDSELLSFAATFLTGIEGTINLEDAFFDSSLGAFRLNLRTALPANSIAAVTQIESTFSEEFSSENSTNSGKSGQENQEEEGNIENIRDTLKNIARETGTNPVIVYALSFPQQLELLVITPEEHIIRKVIPEAHADALQATVKDIRRTITNPRRPDAYFAPSQQLYNWLITPIQSELEGLNIDTLIFSLDAGLRGIPLAALHDGEQFLVEQYSLGLIPSVSLTNTRYAPLHDSRILAMGASEFSEYDPLPAVPLELSLIADRANEGETFLNQDFTFNNLKANSQNRNYQILHLATHADFKAGDAENAHIQLWDEKMQLDRLRELGWTQENPVELLVLSACRTALGDLDAELGFAGLAVNTGAKSALASLWYVSDGGTLNLMGEFYRNLLNPEITIKAEALRQAQIAMIRGEYQQGEVWQEITRSPNLDSASQEFLAELSDRSFTHPYYWSAFTLVGSPW
ncbi:MAG: CHAT domain-containing protein [Cyanobacteria bacterium P01_E01_bin.42]